MYSLPYHLPGSRAPMAWHVAAQPRRHVYRDEYKYTSWSVPSHLALHDIKGCGSKISPVWFFGLVPLIERVLAAHPMCMFAPLGMYMFRPCVCMALARV